MSPDTDFHFWHNLLLIINSGILVYIGTKVDAIHGA